MSSDHIGIIPESNHFSYKRYFESTFNRFVSRMELGRRIQNGSRELYSLANKAKRAVDNYFGDEMSYCLLGASGTLLGFTLLSNSYYPLLTLSSVILMNKIASAYEKNTEKICDEKNEAAAAKMHEEAISIAMEKLGAKSEDEITDPIYGDIPVFGREPREGEYDGIDAFRFGERFYNKFNLIKALLSKGNFDFIDPMGNKVDPESLELLCNMFEIGAEEFLGLWDQAAGMAEAQLESDAARSNVRSETSQVQFLTADNGERTTDAARKFRNEFFLQLVGARMRTDSVEYTKLCELKQ